jgi:hypothetical protein
MYVAILIKYTKLMLCYIRNIISLMCGIKNVII